MLGSWSLGNLDTPGGSGEGCWTPGSVAPEKVWAGGTDLCILGCQVEGEAREWMRPFGERVERGGSQRQHLEDFPENPRRRTEHLGRREVYGKVCRHSARSGRENVSRTDKWFLK